MIFYNVKIYLLIYYELLIDYLISVIDVMIFCYIENFMQYLF
jgi:hypothetical protein